MLILLYERRIMVKLDNIFKLIKEDLYIKLQAVLLTLLLEYRESKRFLFINEFQFLKDVHNKIINAIYMLDEIDSRPTNEKIH